VGAQCELKTIKAGVAAARGKQGGIEDAGGALVEGSVLVLVEPGVYENESVVVDDGECVSIWGCDRESESNKKEMQKVEWRSRDDDTLVARGSAAAVSVNGVHMSATKSEGYDGGSFGCVTAGGRATLSLEGCDLTCEGDAAVAQFSLPETTGVMFGCCIHDGKEGGLFIAERASVTLENNNIHSNTLTGVRVLDEGSEAVLRGNRIHDGKAGGVLIDEGASATLENNNIHSNSRAGVQVEGEGSQVVLRSNLIHDGKEEGVVICEGASATLENNTITDNDLSGVQLQLHATATLNGNTIKGNGQCKIERTEEELAMWSESRVALYRSPNGFPGVRVLNHSTVTMPPGSNTIEGNGKGSTGEQVVVDETSTGN
jgi:parallel beta-helix repeat protein